MRVTGDTWGTYKDIIRCISRGKSSAQASDIEQSPECAKSTRGVLDVSIGARVVGCALKPHVAMTSSAAPPIVRLPAAVCCTEAMSDRDVGAPAVLRGMTETTKKVRFSNPSPFALTVTWECCYFDAHEGKLVDFLCAFDPKQHRFQARVRPYEGSECDTRPFRIAAIETPTATGLYPSASAVATSGGVSAVSPYTVCSRNPSMCSSER